MTTEIWRPLVTRNWASKNHEVSSFGRVRRVDTGKILELPDRSGRDVSPHYCIDAHWWSPKVLVEIVFADLIGKPEKKQSTADVAFDRWIQVEDTPRPTKVKANSRKPKTEKNKAPAVPVSAAEALPTETPEEKLAEMIAQSPPEGDPLVELAQIFYRPQKSTKGNDSEVQTEQTREDKAAQAARPTSGDRVRGVAHVIKLYKASARKRNYDWALTDEQAIYLMVSSCHYCGCDPGTHNQNGLNGIDRKDNALGYLADNVVACCGKCNLMKGTRTEVDFLEHAMAIAKYQSQVKEYANG